MSFIRKDIFGKDVFGFYSNRFFGKNKSDLYITSYFFDDYKFPFKINATQLGAYLLLSNNKVIYTDDSMNNRLTKGKEYIVKSYEKQSGGYYFKLDNDSDMEETYSVDFFSARLIQKDWESITDILISDKLAIQDTGKFLKNE